jgi:hypothetical protein
MAQRRMFSLEVVDTDAFLEMPQSAQLLYFHLSMRADDDGFVDNPKKIMRMIGSSDDDMKILIAKRFIIIFESGIIVIKHWKIHNYIAKDRYHETNYIKEKGLLKVKDNGSYTECIQDVDKMETQVRLGKVRLGEVKEKEINKEKELSIPKESPRQVMENFLKSIQEENGEFFSLVERLCEKGLPREVVIHQLKKFCRHWTEPNKSGTKQKWEMEKTFEVSRRLVTWFENYKKWNQPNNDKKGLKL